MTRYAIFIEFTINGDKQQAERVASWAKNKIANSISEVVKIE